MNGVWKGPIGKTYDAFEHSFYENIEIFGKPVASLIEQIKHGHKSAELYKISKIDEEKGIVTIVYVGKNPVDQ